MKNKVLLLLIIFLPGCQFFSLAPLEITNWSPKTNIVGNVDAVSIELTFSQDVEIETIERSFSLSKPGITINGIFLWYNQKSFKFIPLEELEENVKYDIILTTQAEDIYGNSLNKTFTNSFSTSLDNSRPVITEFLPGDNSVTDNLFQPVTLTFSEEIDPYNFLTNVSISPRVEGYYEWNVNGTSFQFIPTEELSYQQEYKISISESLCDKYGNCLLEKEEFSFSTGTDTETPSILQVTNELNTLILQEDDLTDNIFTLNSNFNKDEKIVIHYSEDMKENTIQPTISFLPDVDFNVTPLTNADYLITFDDPLEYNEYYTMFLKKGAKDLMDNTIEDEVQYNFIVNNPQSKPIELSHITLLSNPSDANSLIEIYKKNTDPAILDLSGYNSGDNAFMDFYFLVSSSGGTPSEIKMFSFMENITITTNNSCADITLTSIEINPVTPNPLNILELQGEEICIVRVNMTIDNNDTAMGFLNVKLYADICDTNNNYLKNYYEIIFHKQ